MSDVRHEPLFPASLEVVSTKHPASGAPLVGLVMAQRIATLGSRAEVEDFIGRLRGAAGTCWPRSTPAGAVSRALSLDDEEAAAADPRPDSEIEAAAQAFLAANPTWRPDALLVPEPQQPGERCRRCGLGPSPCGVCGPLEWTDAPGTVLVEMKPDASGIYQDTGTIHTKGADGSWTASPAPKASG